MRSVFSISLILIVCCSLLFVVSCQKPEKTEGPTGNNLTEPPVFTESDDSNGDTTPVVIKDNNIETSDENKAEATNNAVSTTNDNIQKTSSPPKMTTDGPAITFEDKVYNFGELKPKSKNNCEFKFRNAGNAELRISHVKSTCGCTVPKLAKKNYAPGESGTIKAIYTASGVASPVQKTLYVSSNDKKNPRVGLTLKGNIVLPVRHSPRSVNLLLNEPNGKCPNITLTTSDDQPFAIRSVTSTGGSITAPFDPGVKQTKFVIEPKIDLAKLERFPTGNVTFGLSHPDCPHVIVHYLTKPRFKLDPGMLSVSRAEPMKSTERIVWVLNNYNDEFEIDSISSKEGHLEVLSKEKFGSRYKLEISITPPEPKPEDKNKRFKGFKDTLNIKIKNGKKLTVPCNGTYLIKPGQ